MTGADAKRAMSLADKFPLRELKQGEPCPWCGKPVAEVLTSAPPRCPQCKGFLGPPLGSATHPFWRP